MRPVRALVVVVLGVAFWAGWRGQAVREKLAAEFGAAAADGADLSQAGAVPPPLALGPQSVSSLSGTPPQVMVYTYPNAPGARPGGAVPRIWRIAARQSADVLAPPAPAPPQAGQSARAVPPRARETAPDMRAAAHEAATRAYADLRDGDRRGAAGAFAVALSLAPDHPNAEQWRKQERLLSRHWRVEAYTLIRQNDRTSAASLAFTTAPLPSATPVLGAGASAATIAYTLNPMSRRQIELQARVTVPFLGLAKPDGSAAQGAAGVAFRPFSKIPLTLIAERLFKFGANARNDFQARVTGGAVARAHGLDLSAFGEAGVVGRHPDWFAGGRLLAEKRFALPGGFSVAPGIGTWAAIQQTDRRTSRVDVGPSIHLMPPKGPIGVSVDYRVKLAGNARPGSGVAVTVAGRF